GGLQNPANTLDYSGYAGRVVVSLATRAATGIKDLHGNGLADIQNVVGSSASTNLIVGPSAATTWNLTGPNAGYVNDAMVPGWIRSFSNFAYLTGSSGDDKFAFGAGASVSGALDGGAGQNTLDYSNFVARVTVSLATSAATAVRNASG